MAKEILCAFGVHCDAVAGWLGSYMAARTARATSRAACSPARSACRASLKLFERFGMKTTWFIPGHSIETFPKQTEMVVEAGHEIGMHGYTHENPIAMTPRAGGGDPRQVHRARSTKHWAGKRPRATSRRGGSSAPSPTSCCWSAASGTTTA